MVSARVSFPELDSDRSTKLGSRGAYDTTPGLERGRKSRGGGRPPVAHHRHPGVGDTETLPLRVALRGAAGLGHDACQLASGRGRKRQPGVVQGGMHAAPAKRLERGGAVEHGHALVSMDDRSAHRPAVETSEKAGRVRGVKPGQECLHELRLQLCRPEEAFAYNARPELRFRGRGSTDAYFRGWGRDWLVTLDGPHQNVLHLRQP